MATAPAFIYYTSVDKKRIPDATGESITRETPVESGSPATSMDPPNVYIAACGTLCDAFWWARRSVKPDVPDRP